MEEDRFTPPPGSPDPRPERPQGHIGYVILAVIVMVIFWYAR